MEQLATLIETAGMTDAERVWAVIDAAWERLENMIDPIVLHWQDTDEFEVVPRPHLTDVSWSERDREYEIWMQLDGDTLLEIRDAREAGQGPELIRAWA